MNNILADIDDDSLQGCSRCGDKFAELNYVSFSPNPVSCSSCVPQKSERVNWKRQVEQFVREIARKQKARK